MADLFNYQPRKPMLSPGFKQHTTSKEAAQSMVPTADILRTRVLESLRRSGPATPDEVATRLNTSVLAIRPRFTELSKAGKIEYTGERKKNSSGRSAKEWRCRA